jgi:DNA-binding NarL/FixJ family response regulator
MSQKTRIAIVEDNSTYARSLQEIIKASKGMECMGVYATARECRRAFKADPPPELDIILLDLKLPDQSGLTLIPLFKERAPKAGILVLTTNDDYRSVLEAIKQGVVGYVLKDTPLADLRRIIGEVRDGGSVIDPKLSRLVLNTLREETVGGANSLTDRERQVLELMAKGRVKKEVAEELGISYSAVALYTSNIYEKLQVPNVAAAVATAIRKGLI